MIGCRKIDICVNFLRLLQWREILQQEKQDFSQWWMMMGQIEMVLVMICQESELRSSRPRVVWERTSNVAQH